jgi:hypothetical protein
LGAAAGEPGDDGLDGGVGRERPVDADGCVELGSEADLGVDDAVGSS